MSEADVDIFRVMDSVYYETNGQASLLDKVKRALATIRFTDFRVAACPFREMSDVV